MFDPVKITVNVVFGWGFCCSVVVVFGFGGLFVCLFCQSRVLFWVSLFLTIYAFKSIPLTGAGSPLGHRAL